MTTNRARSIPLEKLNPDLTLLDCPVPPQLEEAIGYPGHSRYVSFGWEDAGGEVIYDDGQIAGTGHFDAYLMFVQHPVIKGSIGFHHLTGDRGATHSMVLDRQERRIYEGRLKAVTEFLAGQHPKPESFPPELTLEEFQKMTKRLQAEMGIPSVEVIHDQARKHNRLVAEMKAWLMQFLR